MEHLKDLQIKDSWERITISDFMAIQEITKSKNLTAIQKTLRILAKLSGISYEQLKGYQCTLSDFKELDTKLEFLKTPPDVPLNEFYTIGGKVYKLIGNIASLTTGQYIDLDSLSKDAAGIVDNLHVICSIFLLPVIQKTFIQRLVEKTGLMKFRSLENYMETPLPETYENLYENMLYQDANAICLFFCAVGTLYTAISKDCLKQEIREKINSALKMLSENQPTSDNQARMVSRLQEKIISMANGVGIAV